MRVACVICSDAFFSFTDVSAIPCGHTFHTHCIFQWIENSKSCPTCRHKATVKNVLKLYFDSPSADTQIDPDSLQYQIDSLKFQVVERKQEVKNVKEENGKLTKASKELRQEVIHLEKKVQDKETTIFALREQTKYLQTLIKDVSQAQEEAKQAKQQLKLFKQIKLVVDENASQIEDTIACNSLGCDGEDSVRNLSTIVCILKRRMNQILEEKQIFSEENGDLANKLRMAKKSLQVAENKLVDLEKEHTLLKVDIQAVEKENASLQKKIVKLQDAIVSPSADVKNSVIHRLLSESPAPLAFEKRSDKTHDLEITPEITRKAPRYSGSDNDSRPMSSSQSQSEHDMREPYLPVKSTSVAFNFASAHPSSSKLLLRMNKPLGFKGLVTSTGSSQEEKSCNVLGGYGYDGLGGRHKVDYFPVPNRNKGYPLKQKASQMTKPVNNRVATQISSRTIRDFFKDPFS